MDESPSYNWNERNAEQLGRQVNAWRKRRELQVSELARKVGVSPSLVSQIERGASQPSVATLFALAESLEVPVDAFFGSDEAGGPAGTAPYSGLEDQDWVPATKDEGQEPMADYAFVVRGNARDSVEIEGGVRWERLVARQIPTVDFLELIYAPGAESHADLYRHPGSEMVVVLRGKLEITISFETYELAAGDSIHFPSTYPHRYVNPSQDEEARAISVIVHESALD